MGTQYYKDQRKAMLRLDEIIKAAKAHNYKLNIKLVYYDLVRSGFYVSERFVSNYLKQYFKSETGDDDE